MNLGTYGLYFRTPPDAPTHRKNPTLAREKAYDADEERLRHDEMGVLGDEQQRIYDAVMGSVQDAAGTVFYADGEGGAGKTFLYEKLLHRVRAEGWVPLAVAMSGIAALLLPGGTTAHHRFRLPVPLPLTDAVCNVGTTTDLAGLLREARLLIWDEAPTASKSAIDAVDRCLRDVRGVARPFGGLTTLLGGDFRQIPPVLRHIPRGEFAPFTIKASRIWTTPDAVERYTLPRNQRAIKDPAYADFLRAIGDGLYSGYPASEDPLLREPASVLLPASISAPEAWTGNTLLDWVYEGVLRDADRDVVEQLEFYQNRAVITPTNDAASALNEEMLHRFPGLPREYFSADSIAEEGMDTVSYPVEFLNGLDAGGLPPHCLRLKLGALLICLRNFSPHRGVCNGTHLYSWRRWGLGFSPSASSPGPKAGIGCSSRASPAIAPGRVTSRSGCGDTSSR